MRVSPFSKRLFVVGLAERGQDAPVHARRRLNDERDDVLVVRLVEVGQFLRGMLVLHRLLAGVVGQGQVGLVAGVRTEVPVRAVGDAFQLVKAQRRELVQNVHGALGVVRKFDVFKQFEPVARQADGVHPPVHMVLNPLLVDALVLAGLDEVFDLHLLQFADAKKKFLGVISLRKDLPVWAMPKGNLRLVESSTFLKLTNMPWAVSGRR